MSQTNTPHKYQQRPVEDILDFCTLLGSRMIASGANLERVKLQMNRLQSLNSLCYSIAKHTPSPKDLFFYALGSTITIRRWCVQMASTAR